MGVPSESTLATTLTKTDHHRAILHDLFTLIDRLDRYFDSLATSGGEEDRPEYRENASFSHDARVLREVLSTYSGLLACATLLTRDLVRRQAAISAIPGYESGTPVLYAGTGGNEE